MGITVYGLKRHKEYIMNQVITINESTENRFEITNKYNTEEIYGMLFRGGMQWMPDDSISPGLMLSYGHLFEHTLDSQYLKKGNVRFPSLFIMHNLKSDSPLVNRA